MAEFDLFQDDALFFREAFLRLDRSSGERLKDYLPLSLSCDVKLMKLRKISERFGPASLIGQAFSSSLHGVSIPSSASIEAISLASSAIFHLSISSGWTVSTVLFS